MHSPQDDAVSIPTSNPDLLVNNVGTLYTFCPLTARAKTWIDEHVQDDALVRARTCRRTSVRVGTGSGDVR